jgi:tetratricopeptide (TPR) repeat protein
MSIRTVGLVLVPAAALAAFVTLGPVLASSSGGGGSSGAESADRSAPEVDEADQLFARGMELVKEGKFEEARGRFERAHDKRKKDADILNMLAYTQRKTGRLDDAFENYAKALELKPRFPQAREYLGEAHIQAALLQIKTLREYGPEAEKELADLVAALRTAAESLQPAMGMGAASERSASEKKESGW